MLKTLLYLFCPWLELHRLRKENEELEATLAMAEMALSNNVAGIVLAAGGEVFVPRTIIDFVGRNDFVALDYSPEQGGVRVTVGFAEGGEEYDEEESGPDDEGGCGEDCDGSCGAEGGSAR